MQAYTHFRSVFDVSPAGPMENPWAAVVGEIRAWMARKEKDPLKGFFFNGGSWTAPAPAWARVETRALSDDGATPEMWAVRYEHVDSEVKSRRWSTNIGVMQVGPQEWRMAVELTHRLRPGFVGREPAAPQPSSPRLVTGLLDSPNWVATTVVGTYAGSLWVRADTAGATLKLRFREYSGPTFMGSAMAQVTLSTSWQLVTVTYTPAAPGASTLDFNAYLSNAPTGTCFYADDAAVSRN